MKTFIQKNIIRLMLTVLLLWQVFTHSHWSVGLSLTLLFIATEISTYILQTNL
jgi:hypothetical protein